ncbi:hypothetical protein F4861DRAFT_544671, partial [Xylaria intraflava]
MGDQSTKDESDLSFKLSPEEEAEIVREYEQLQAEVLNNAGEAGMSARDIIHTLLQTICRERNEFEQMIDAVAKRYGNKEEEKPPKPAMPATFPGTPSLLDSQASPPVVSSWKGKSRQKPADEVSNPETVRFRCLSPVKPRNAHPTVDKSSETSPPESKADQPDDGDTASPPRKKPGNRKKEGFDPPDSDPDSSDSDDSDDDGAAPTTEKTSKARWHKLKLRLSPQQFLKGVENWVSYYNTLQLAMDVIGHKRGKPIEKAGESILAQTIAST